MHAAGLVCSRAGYSTRGRAWSVRARHSRATSGQVGAVEQHLNGDAELRPAVFVRSDDPDGLPVLVARGEIDVYTSPDFRRELAALVAGDAKRVVVDLAAVDFIDSSGLGVLVGALKRLRERDGSIVLRGMTPSTKKVFDITGLTNLFSTEP